MKDRYANLRHIRSLDPRRDYLAIYQLMVRYEFPWDMKLGLNLAFNGRSRYRGSRPYTPPPAS